MIEHLDKTGVENEVMAHTSAEVKPVIKPNKNVHVLKCFTKLDKPFYFIKQAKIYKAAKNEFELSEFDITHSYSLFSSGNCSYEIYKHFNVPYVVAIRDTDIHVFLKLKPYLKHRGYTILKNASKVFFLSPTYMEETANLLIPSEERKTFFAKCEIIPNGIDDFWLNNIYHDRSTYCPSNIKILHVGELTQRKNAIAVIEAVQLLREEGFTVELTVIGKKVDESIFKMIEKEKDVKYHSAMPKEELIHYYRDNDLFVLPSFTETFGLVYAEAMSQGCPVLYTKGQGFDGQFEDGKIGYAINPYSAKNIAEKIILILKNYTLLSNNCISSVNKFSWSQITNKYASIYDEIITSQKNRI